MFGGGATAGTSRPRARSARTASRRCDERTKPRDRTPFSSDETRVSGPRSRRPSCHPAEQASNTAPLSCERAFASASLSPSSASRCSARASARLLSLPAPPEPVVGSGGGPRRTRAGHGVSSWARQVHSFGKLSDFEQENFDKMLPDLVAQAAKGVKFVNA